MRYFTDPENAYPKHKWAVVTPLIIFGTLHIIVQAVKLNLNMLYLFSIYAIASYSAWSWARAWTALQKNGQAAKK